MINNNKKYTKNNTPDTVLIISLHSFPNHPLTTLPSPPANPLLQAYNPSLTLNHALNQNLFRQLHLRQLPLHQMILILLSIPSFFHSFKKVF